MGVRIQELPETTGINKEDVLIVEDGQGTKKGTVKQLDETLGVSQLKEDIADNRETLIQMNKSLSEFEVGEYTVENGYYDLSSPTVKKDNSNYQCIKMATDQLFRTHSANY